GKTATRLGVRRRRHPCEWASAPPHLLRPVPLSTHERTIPMDPLAATLVGISLLLVAYTYAGYPLLLRLIGGWLPRREAPRDPREWPSVSITVPAYNEEAQIAGVLDALLALDYPAERRQI